MKQAASTQAPGGHLLEVRDLQVSFFTRRGTANAVRGVSFHIDESETLGIVGESGSGKSVTAQAILGLIQLPGKIVGGDILWNGRSLLNKANAKYSHSVRGKDLSVVFQDPMTSLNPVLTVGTQIGESLRHHMGMNRKQARERAAELLDLVGIAFPRQRVKQYPHEFSGGMRQRVMIAMALATDPKLLIADEPTTALDVTIQAQILELLQDLQERLRLSVMLITHDLGVVAGMCRRVGVMYAGKLVEEGSADGVFSDPGDPYAAGLLRSTPRPDARVPRMLTIEGAPPDLVRPPSGCPFHPRCPIAERQCEESMPDLTLHTGGRKVACYRAFDDAIKPRVVGNVNSG
jgi:peptide/nickel transport system ATP-binding protein